MIHVRALATKGVDSGLPPAEADDELGHSRRAEAVKSACRTHRLTLWRRKGSRDARAAGRHPRSGTGGKEAARLSVQHCRPRREVLRDAGER